MNRIVPLILLIIGTFGHTWNLLILSKKAQRRNPTALCFLATTIANIIALYFGMFIRYLQDVSNIDLIDNYPIICKLRSFVVYLFISLSNWYIVLAVIDRYLISSSENDQRRLSSMKNAYVSIGFITIFLTVAYCHIPLFYNIHSSTCTALPGSYRLFNDIQTLIQFSLLPPLLMLFFGLLTLRNIRLTHRRVANLNSIRLRQRDIQLSKMLFLQVIITIVCSLPLIVTQLMSTMTTTMVKSPLRLTIELFASQVSRHLAFLNCSISFYLYTLSGSQFRLEIQQMVNRFLTVLQHRTIPTNTSTTPNRTGTTTKRNKTAVSPYY